MAVAITVAIVAAVVAAAAAGYGSYASSQAAAQNARMQKKAAQLQAEQEAAAGEARRKQIALKHKRFAASARARAGGSGVFVGEGSLLEGQMEAANLAEYEAQLAAYPHELASQRASFESKIFGVQQRRAEDSALSGAVISGVGAGASSLASSYGSGAFKSTGGGGYDRSALASPNTTSYGGKQSEGF